MVKERGSHTRRLLVVVILFCTLAIPLFVLSGCGKQLTRMEENQVKLQAMVAANARDLATISSQLDAGQGKINTSLQTLDGDTKQVAANVATVQQQQLQFRQTVVSGHEGLNRRIGSVEENQRSLQASVAQVSDVTQHTEADLASLTQQHTALAQTIRANNQQTTDQLTALAANDRQLSTGVANVQTSLQTAATNLAAANSALKEQVSTSHDNLTAQIAGLSASQQHLQAGIEALSGKAEQTAADLTTTRSALQETLKVNRDVLTGQIAASLQNQQALHSDVRDLSDKADKLTNNVGEVATEQKALHEMVRANHDVVITAMAGLSDRHDTLRTGLDRLDGKSDRLAGDLASLATQQLSLYEAMKANHDALITKLADVSGNQTKLEASVGSVNGKAEEIAAVQDTFRQTFQGHSASVNAGLAGLAQGQQALHDQMDTLTATTGQTARDVAALNNGQATLRQAVQTAEKNLSDKADQTAAGLGTVARQQTTLQQSINAGQTALTARASELAGGQQALKSSINDLGQAVSGRVAKMAEGQQQIQSSLDTLTATAGQTALDVMAMSTRQDAIRTALQSHDVASRVQMTGLVDSQQQAQSSLDTVTALTGQASLDTLAMNKGQGQLEQTVRAGRQEVTAKLAAMAQDQQNWSNRLDAAQAKIATIADNIAALEQQIGKLQGVLQTSLQGTTNLVGATSQQRTQFETKVSQDIRAVIESLAQLRQTQTSLQEQITQVQKSTQGQADNLRSVIEQMKPAPHTTERVSEPAPAPAEVKVSAVTEPPQAPAAVESMPEAAE